MFSPDIVEWFLALHAPTQCFLFCDKLDFEVCSVCGLQISLLIGIESLKIAMRLPLTVQSLSIAIGLPWENQVICGRDTWNRVIERKESMWTLIVLKCYMRPSHVNIFVQDDAKLQWNDPYKGSPWSSTLKQTTIRMFYYRLFLHTYLAIIQIRIYSKTLEYVW